MQLAPAHDPIGAPAFGHQINVYIEADMESLIDEDAHQALCWIYNPQGLLCRYGLFGIGGGV